jgi:peroxisomal 2,4-dienoyl-CoA reductase
VRALVYLGANACILGRNEEKTRAMAQDIERVRNGSRVIPIAVDVRDADQMAAAADTCNTELGGIDFVMCVTVLLKQKPS